MARPRARYRPWWLAWGAVLALALPGGRATAAQADAPILSAPLKPWAGPRWTSDVVLRALKHPQVSVRGSRVAAERRSPFALEVLAADRPRGGASPSRPRYRALRATQKGGLALVDVRRDQV